MSITYWPGSKTWSAVFYVRLPSGERRRHTENLGVPIRGGRPPSPTEPGDSEFEKSRVDAQAAHDKLVASIKNPLDAIAAADRAVEIATSKRVTVLSLFDLYEIWLNAPREKGTGPDEETKRNYKTYFTHFQDFMRRTYPGVSDMRLVDPSVVAAWSAALAKDGIRFSTYNHYVSALTTVWRYAAIAGNLKLNPFELLPRTANKSAVAHRLPYLRDEVRRILEACESDPMVGPIVVVANTTGMRRRDCILIKWASIDFEAGPLGTIQCRANKSGEDITVPLLPNLRKVLEGRSRDGEYVFPEAAAIFLAKKDNKNFFLNRLKLILAKAGINYDERNKRFKSPHKRRRKASISGWHAFKTTFVTLAIDAGVPMELLKKVVGNKCVDLIWEVYYAPTHGTIAETLIAKMPRELTGQDSPVETARQMIERLTPENAVELRAKLLELVK
jgi:integrase